MIVINNKNYSGKNINICNGKIIIDGIEINSADEKIINIIIEKDFEGNLDIKECNSIEIKGDIHGNVKTVNGDIRCNDVKGSINTVNGDINAHKILGDVESVNGNITSK